MEFDKEKMEEVILALLYQDSYKSSGPNIRSWKNYNWDVLDSLYEKGFISDPAKKNARSLSISEEAHKLGKTYFEKHFGTGKN